MNWSRSPLNPPPPPGPTHLMILKSDNTHVLWMWYEMFCTNVSMVHTTWTYGCFLGLQKHCLLRFHAADWAALNQSQTSWVSQSSGCSCKTMLGGTCSGDVFAHKEAGRGMYIAKSLRKKSLRLVWNCTVRDQASLRVTGRGVLLLFPMAARILKTITRSLPHRLLPTV